MYLVSAPIVLGTILSIGSAASYDLTNDCALTLSGSVGTVLDGTLIGDWDAETNPEGTQTRPGVWGGSGNNPIPLSMTVTLELAGSSVPVGPLDLEIDAALNLATITNLSWNVLSETVMPASVTVTVLYDTFRSITPTSLYPGGVPIDLPLGEGSVTSCLLTQSVQAIGTATPIDDEPDSHTIMVAVGAMLDMIIQSDAMGELPLQIPIVLLIEGVHHAGTLEDTLSMTATAMVDEAGDLPGEPLPSIPWELPTVLPPGDFAGVLIDLTPSTAAITLSLDADLNAISEHGQQNEPGDVNGDGLVNTDDLLAVLAAFGPCDGCPEDFNGDGVVNVNDILTVVGNWST